MTGQEESSKPGLAHAGLSPVWKRQRPSSEAMGSRPVIRLKFWATIVPGSVRRRRIRASLRMQHLCGRKGESEHSNVVFLAESLCGLRDFFRGPGAEIACAFEAEELSSGVAGLNDAI